MITKRIKDICESIRGIKTLYHLTSKDKVDSILKDGLISGREVHTKTGGNLGVYLTDSPYDVMAGGDFPTPANNLAIITVDSSGLTLEYDPEFYTEYRNDSQIDQAIENDEEGGFYYCKSNIPASSLRVDKSISIRFPSGRVLKPNESL